MTLPGENGQNLVEWRFRKEQTRGKVIVFGRKLRVRTRKRSTPGCYLGSERGKWGLIDAQVELAESPRRPTKMLTNQRRIHRVASVCVPAEGRDGATFVALFNEPRPIGGKCAVMS